MKIPPNTDIGTQIITGGSCDSFLRPSKPKVDYYNNIYVSSWDCHTISKYIYNSGNNS
jgi:hypothetical protein